MKVTSKFNEKSKIYKYTLYSSLIVYFVSLCMLFLPLTNKLLADYKLIVLGISLIAFLIFLIMELCTLKLDK